MNAVTAQLLSADRALYVFMYGQPHTPFLDASAMVLSGLGYGGLVWIAVAVLLMLREERKDRRFFIPVTAAVFSSWFLSEVAFKPLFARIRPSAVIRVFDTVNGQGGYSFPSSHATTAFAMAAVLSRYEPGLAGIWYALAVLIGWSRIYLGVHYPGDVLAGAVIGWSIGTVISVLVIPRRLPNGSHGDRSRR